VYLSGNARSSSFFGLYFSIHNESKISSLIHYSLKVLVQKLLIKDPHQLMDQLDMPELKSQ
jgi:hypothetical protein